MSESLTVQIQAVLNAVNDDIRDAVKRNVDSVAKEAVQKLRDSSPKKTGDYASGWSLKRQGEADAVIYNRKQPGLTHLLENGHVIKNKKGTFGRVSGKKHIKPVEEWANEELSRRILEEIP